MKVAVFDVCGTLYHSNTTFEFLDYYFEGDAVFNAFRYFSRSILGKLFNYPFRKFFHYDLLRAIAIGFLKGEEETVVKKTAQQFVDEYLENKVNKQVLDLLELYRKQDFELVLMSGSLDYIVSEVAVRLRVNAFFASHLLAKNGLLTGLYAQDTLLAKKSLLSHHYPVIEKLIVVTDNLTDLNLVAIADKAHIVCTKEKHRVFWNKRKFPHVEFVG